MAKPKILQQLNAEKESKILLASNPTVNMEAATKTYVDTKDATTKTYVDTKVTNVAKTTGATFTGTIVANGASTLTTGQVRNIYCSTSEPTSSYGQIGDIWLVYEA